MNPCREHDRSARGTDPFAWILAFLVLGTLWRTLDFYFLGDDFNFLTGNYRDGQLLPLFERLGDYVRPITGDFSWSFVRPTTLLFFWLDSSWWGSNPVGFRITTLAFQMAAVLGLYALALRVHLPRVFAFAWAALFALHPLSVESYSWLSARSDIMVTCFGTWGTWLLLNPLLAGDEAKGSSLIRKMGLGFVGLLFICLAATSKEHGVVFLILPLSNYIASTVASRGVRGSIGHGGSWLALGAIAGLAIGFALYRHYILGTFVGGYSGRIHPFTSFLSTWELFQSHAWPWTTASSLPIHWLLVLGGILTLRSTMISKTWNLPGLAFLGTTLLVGHVVVSTFTFHAGSFHSMRLGYAMLLPFSFLLALGLWGLATTLVDLLARRGAGQPVFLTAVVLLLGGFAIQQQANLGDFARASRIMESFVHDAQVLDSGPDQGRKHVIYDLPRDCGNAFAGINLVGRGNELPFFDPADPVLLIRPTSRAGWKHLAQDLFDNPGRIELHRWSPRDNRVIPATIAPIEWKRGRVIVAGGHTSRHDYRIGNTPNRVFLVHEPARSSIGKVGRIFGYEVEGEEETVFLGHSFLADDERIVLDLTSESDRLSWSEGGTQTFNVEMDPRHAGQVYFVLGSLSGTGFFPLPGGLYVPLKLDGYSAHLITGPNTLITNSFGVLDQKGRARAQMYLPPKWEHGRVGMKFTHACLVLDPIDSEFVAVSEPSSFVLTK